MNTNFNIVISRVTLSKPMTLGIALALMFGCQTAVNAEEHHEHQLQHEHMDHHEHHKAAAEATGYKRLLADYGIPDVRLVDSEGRKELLSETVSPNEPVMLNFIFTTCTTICPSMSATFAQVARKMEVAHEPMQLISISVDPEHDTPERLREFARQFYDGSHWRLFTGTTGDSIAVQRAFDAYRGDKMNHIPLTFIRGTNSNRWARIDGLASADELIGEYKALEKK